MLKSYHVIWQSAIDVFRFFDPSPSSKQRRPSVTTSVSPGQSALYSVYVSPNTPASAVQSLFDVLVRDIYDITPGARVCAGGLILHDFTRFSPYKTRFRAVRYATPHEFNRADRPYTRSHASPDVTWPWGTEYSMYPCGSFEKTIIFMQNGT